MKFATTRRIVRLKALKTVTTFALALSTSMAYGVSDGGSEVFLSRLKDPESPDVSQELRIASQSVASVGYGSGYFFVEVPEEFLKRSVQLAPGKTQLMKDFILENLGGLSRNGNHHYIKLNKIKDHALSFLKKYEIPVESKIQWRGDELLWGASPEKLAEDIRRSQLLPGNSHCTGFTVGDDIGFTNHHCGSTQEKCDILSFRFNEELDPTLTQLKKLDAYRCKEVLLSDPELDFSLVRLEGAPGKAHGKLVLSEKDPTEHYENQGLSFWPFEDWVKVPAQTLRVIGHPVDHPDYPLDSTFQDIKKITEPCKALNSISLIGFSSSMSVGDQAMPTFDLDALLGEGRYKQILDTQWRFPTDCPVVGGSSGSPVLDSRQRVVGIVHASIEASWVEDPKSTPKSFVIPMSKIFEKHRARLAELGIFSEEDLRARRNANENTELTARSTSALKKNLAGAEAVISSSTESVRLSSSSAR